MRPPTMGLADSAPITNDRSFRTRAIGSDRHIMKLTEFDDDRYPQSLKRRGRVRHWEI